MYVILTSIRSGGAGRNRTGNLLDAIETLSCLSYSPVREMRSGGATGNCTPIPAVRKQSSPVELSPQTAGRNSHGLRRASGWRPRKTRWSGPRGRDADVVPCSRAGAATSRIGRCMRGKRWCWDRRRNPWRGARGPRRTCSGSSTSIAPFQQAAKELNPLSEGWKLGRSP